MSEHTPLDDLKEEAGNEGKDKTTRRILVGLFILWLLTLGLAIYLFTSAYLDERSKSQTLAEQIAAACGSGHFESSGLSEEDEDALCSNADKVIEDGGEIQDGEIQESEVQDPEIQNPEQQEREIQDRENQNQELQGAEAQDPEEQEPEIQDPEEQEPEVQDPENQDPEINDPDPNDQIQGGSCEFSGQGTITITLQTNNGPVTFSCTGTNTP